MNESLSSKPYILLIPSETKLFFFDTFLGDNVDVNGVTSIDIPFSCRRENILHHSYSFV